MSNQQQTEAAAIAALASVGKLQSEGGEVPFIVLPSDCKVQDLEGLQAAPRRVREAVKMTAVESFIAYLAKHKTPNTVIFANEETRTMRAVVDYHNGNNDPDWCDHKVEYTAALSREWKGWMGNHGKALSQVDFADFIEERVVDIVEPSGAQMLEIATKLHVIQKSVFGSAIRLQSGEFQLQWSNDNQKGTVEVPEKIVLGIPVLHNGAAFKVEARLRYRLQEGQVHFVYKIVEPERTVETAFAKQRTAVAEGLAGVPIYDGSK